MSKLEFKSQDFATLVWCDGNSDSVAKIAQKKFDDWYETQGVELSKYIGLYANEQISNNLNITTAHDTMVKFEAEITHIKAELERKTGKFNNLSDEYDLLVNSSDKLEDELANWKQYWEACDKTKDLQSKLAVAKRRWKTLGAKKK